MSESSDHPVWLTASQPECGIVGMVNCLRQEPGGNRIRYDIVNSSLFSHCSFYVERITPRLSVRI